MIGRRFNMLTVLADMPSSKGYSWWRCVCDCGREAAVRGAALRSGATKSCGCLLTKFNIATKTKHGLANSPEWVVWKSMRARCLNPKSSDFPNYGGRGITICGRWQGEKGFENFVADMGRRPKGLTLDRIDNDGNYEPGNCRWATWSQQRLNQRRELRKHTERKP